ncbi:hypothetical protein MKX03_007790 [Papaver bracteatum]|nr:hypothetical protein MKX03_007790 [Papaver bracteatum]
MKNKNLSQSPSSSLILLISSSPSPILRSVNLFLINFLSRLSFISSSDFGCFSNFRNLPTIEEVSKDLQAIRKSNDGGWILNEVFAKEGWKRNGDLMRKWDGKLYD